MVLNPTLSNLLSQSWWYHFYSHLETGLLGSHPIKQHQGCWAWLAGRGWQQQNLWLLSPQGLWEVCVGCLVLSSFQGYASPSLAGPKESVCVLCNRLLPSVASQRRAACCPLGWATFPILQPFRGVSFSGCPSWGREHTARLPKVEFVRVLSEWLMQYSCLTMGN